MFAIVIVSHKLVLCESLQLQVSLRRSNNSEAVRLVRARPLAARGAGRAKPDSRQHLAVIWMALPFPRILRPYTHTHTFSRKMFYVITSEMCCFAFARQMIHRSIVFCLFCPPPLAGQEHVLVQSRAALGAGYGALSGGGGLGGDAVRGRAGGRPAVRV